MKRAWDPIQRYWREPTIENRNALRGALTLEGLKEQYITTPHPELVKPEGYTLDAALISRPGNADIQLDLFLDYRNNVKLYPEFQRYFREKQPRTLAVWDASIRFSCRLERRLSHEITPMLRYISSTRGTLHWRQISLKLPLMCASSCQHERLGRAARYLASVERPFGARSWSRRHWKARHPADPDVVYRCNLFNAT